MPGQRISPTSPRRRWLAAAVFPLLVSVLEAPLPADHLVAAPPPCPAARPADDPSPEVAALLDPRRYRHYHPSDLVMVAGSHPRNTAYLHPLVAAPFIRMRNAAMADGLEMRISSAWRSWQRQLRAHRIFLRTGRNLSGDRVPYVAHPAESRHPAGVAVDLRIEDNDPLVPWLQANAGCFGFVNTREDEPWEWQFTGMGADVEEGPRR